MRCPKSRFSIQIIVFDKLELIIFVSQGLTLSTASLVELSFKFKRNVQLFLFWCSCLLAQRRDQQHLESRRLLYAMGNVYIWIVLRPVHCWISLHCRILSSWDTIKTFDLQQEYNSSGKLFPKPTTIY